MHIHLPPRKVSEGKKLYLELSRQHFEQKQIRNRNRNRQLAEPGFNRGFVCNTNLTFLHEIDIEVVLKVSVKNKVALQWEWNSNNNTRLGSISNKAIIINVAWNKNQDYAKTLVLKRHCLIYHGLSFRAQTHHTIETNNTLKPKTPLY